MRLSTIIVSYNTSDLVRNCLTSLAAHPPPAEAQVIVVDNASRDDTVAMVRREFPDALVIANETNLGYAAAVNQGLQAAEADFYLILNSDIEVHEGSIGTLLDFMRGTPRAGMCAPQLILPSGEPQQTWREGFTLGQFARQEFMLDKLKPRRALEAAPAEASEVEHLDGAALLVRREALAQVGLLDEGYFMYCEDSDWALRFRRAGWSLYHVPAATMLHHHGASSRECRAEMIAAYKLAAGRYFRLHDGALNARLAHAIGLTGTALRLLGAALGSVLTLGLYRPLVRKTALFAKALDIQARPRGLSPDGPKGPGGG